MYALKKLSGGLPAGQKRLAGEAFLPNRNRYRGISQPLKNFIQHTFLNYFSYVSLVVKSSFFKTGVLKKLL
jgi:hypothetical protein